MAPEVLGERPQGERIAEDEPAEPERDGEQQRTGPVVAEEPFATRAVAYGTGHATVRGPRQRVHGVGDPPPPAHPLRQDDRLERLEQHRDDEQQACDAAHDPHCRSLPRTLTKLIRLARSRTPPTETAWRLCSPGGRRPCAVIVDPTHRPSNVAPPPRVAPRS